MCDVSDPAQVTEQVEHVLRRLGRIDVLINNAGIVLDKTLAKLTMEDFDRVHAVNVRAVVAMTKAVVPYMADRNYGVILNASSVVSSGNFGQSAYASSKAAIESLTVTWARELAKSGIRVNAVAPGFSRTPMTEELLANPHVDALYRRESALGELVTPDQVAATVAHLAARDCFISGEIVQVSGGAQLCRLPRGDELKG